MVYSFPGRFYFSVIIDLISEMDSASMTTHSILPYPKYNFIVNIKSTLTNIIIIIMQRYLPRETTPGCNFLCTALLKYKSKISTPKKSKRGGGMSGFPRKFMQPFLFFVGHTQKYILLLPH